MSNVDPVAVAHYLLTQLDVGGTYIAPLLPVEAESVARVVLAAEERVKHDHSRGCASLIPGTYFGQADKQCTCGHDALAAVLRGVGK
jgi:hypothetical protein